MNAVLDLQGVKDLYKKGVKYAKDNYSSIFFTRDDELFDYQLTLVDHAKDLNTVMNTIWLPNQTWQNSFKPPQPICSGCELSHTGMQFGVGHLEWYFFSGVTESYTFNICFFKHEIAPPDVVDIDPSEAVRWIIQGGYGDRGGTWHSLPPEWLYLKYNKLSYSTFTLEGGNDKISAKLSSLKPMNFEIELNFDNQNIKISTSANTPPLPNFKDACACSQDLGTFYYSYPDNDVTFYKDNNISNGKGWIDHQLTKNGVPKSIYIQALIASLNLQSKSAGWLWTIIQDFTTDTQYMLIYFFGKKYYSESVELDKIIDFQVVNVYKDGTVDNSPVHKPQIKMIETFNHRGINLPKKYSVKFPHNRQAYLEIASNPNIYTMNVESYETPAILYDDKGDIIGSGLIEANVYYDNDYFAKNLLKFVNGSLDKLDLIKNSIVKPFKLYQKILGFFVILLPLWMVIITAVFILKGKQRSPRIGLSIAIFLILLALTF